MFVYRQLAYVLLILFYLVGVRCFAADDLVSTCVSRHCTAVIDVGSTGSRIHVFAYDLNSNEYPIHVDELYSKKIKPGLASIALNDDAIDNYMTSLMLDFPEASIPLYVYATAGMRLVPEDTQQYYYHEMTRWLADHTSLMLEDMRTISGLEEGVFGWLALNHHLKVFSGQNKSLAGLLEIGGASAQIAFPVQDTANLDPHDLVSLNINGRNLTLFTHSFLGLGVNEIYNHAQDRAACFPKGYPLSNGKEALGNAQICQAQLGQMIDDQFDVKRFTHSALEANLINDWYTVSAISMMANQAPFDFQAGEFTAQDLLYQANSQLCHQAYQPLVSQYPQNEFILRNCLMASYFYGLLVHGYGFSPSQDVHYLPGYDADWALGVILYQSQTEKTQSSSGL